MNNDLKKLNVALPDGHLMAHVLPFLERAGIRFEGYGAVETMDMKVIAREGSITTSGTLAGEYVLTLLDMEGSGAVLEIEVLVSGSPAYRHEFTVDEENE